jgi:hypothetical protein
MNGKEQRHRAGLGLLGASIWVLVILCLYTGWTFFPVVLNKGRVERSIEYSLQGMAHSSTEEDIRQRVVTKGSSPSIQLADEDILVIREVEHGRRTFHVDVTFPQVVRYLGSDRTVTSHLQLTHVIEVDEVALAREQEYERKRMAEYEAQQVKARAFARKVEAAHAECEEKWGKGNCTVTETYGGDSNSIMKMY